MQPKNSSPKTPVAFQQVPTHPHLRCLIPDPHSCSSEQPLGYKETATSPYTSLDTILWGSSSDHQSGMLVASPQSMFSNDGTVVSSPNSTAVESPGSMGMSAGMEDIDARESSKGFKGSKGHFRVGFDVIAAAVVARARRGRFLKVNMVYDVFDGTSGLGLKLMKGEK